jgi:hypothetical protein
MKNSTLLVIRSLIVIHLGRLSITQGKDAEEKKTAKHFLISTRNLAIFFDGRRSEIFLFEKIIRVSPEWYSRPREKVERKF